MNNLIGEARYRKLLDRLIANHDFELSSDEIADLEYRAKVMTNISSRHHYIPQHYIKGFTGEDGLLSVYDKRLDKVKENRIGSKGVFYETDRNTVRVDDLKISIIEDYLFGKSDSKLAECVRSLREESTNSALSINNQGMVAAVLIDLFWRNPLTDSAFEDMLLRSTMTFTDPLTKSPCTNSELEKKYKTDPFYKKIERSKMTLNAINAILAGKQAGSSFSKLWEFEKELFIIGDFPMLYEQTPRTHSDLLTLNYYFPISSNRIYSSNKKSGLNFKDLDAYLLNALIIDQSQKIVCCSNRSVLEKSVSCYKIIKSKGMMPFYKKFLFSKI